MLDFCDLSTTIARIELPGNEEGVEFIVAKDAQNPSKMFVYLRQSKRIIDGFVFDLFF